MTVDPTECFPSVEDPDDQGLGLGPPEEGEEGKQGGGEETIVR